MPKENRRQARIQAVQQLYAREMRGVLVAAGGTDEPMGPIEGEASPFAEDLVAQALGRLEEIDRLLVAALQNWDLRRLGAVDRAILRLAVAEMLVHPDIPAAVTINEAIEIARSLASTESARFANGVLDRVRKEIGRDPRAVS
ncbi:MAG: transcription antitermination factor NusB [Chthoniobacterales bacterium]